MSTRNQAPSFNGWDGVWKEERSGSVWSVPEAPALQATTTIHMEVEGL
jgi:hypothetical protein